MARVSGGDRAGRSEAPRETMRTRWADKHCGGGREGGSATTADATAAVREEGTRA